eukprot:TRINITY_DN11444_c0_g2_i1.p1 TRINITY_DN11444_c0_g2~~TRINITY_DN11444_c0_g2_i1.p1  ORF type:complete len:450 (+),score=125.20 TRINITY_DN11444_c0_g2_i1:106-1350(+)
MAQEHQEYIQQKVNPILENMVTQLLLERPENMTSFMVKWLSEYSKIPLSAVASEGVNTLADLKSELAALQKEVSDLELDVAIGSGDAAVVTSSKARDDSEAEEEDDEEGPDIDDMPLPAAYLSRGPRTSVSAEAYGVWNKKGDWTPPVYPKTDEQKAKIREVLNQSFLFSCLDAQDINVLIDAMQAKAVEAGTRLIEQGEDGDCLYVVEEGQMDCYKRQPNGEEKLVKECKVGDAFGELALLYNCPRAASVVASTTCSLMQLDRDSFNNIVKDAASKRRERYEDFLRSVPVLQSMDDYERKAMCDALNSEKVEAGTVIVQQGEPGDKFYILEDGKAVAHKVYVAGTSAKEVMRYGSGDYFGELALLRDESRAATVTAVTDCKLLSFSRKSFKALLGPLEDMLTRNATERYEPKP